MTDKTTMTTTHELRIEEMLQQAQEQSRLLERTQVVFIIGPAKSGTTWLMRSLDHHPQIVARGECGICSHLLPGLIAAFRQYNDHHRTHSIPATLYSDAEFLLILRQVYDRLLLRYIADGAQSAGEMPSVVIDKTPSNSEHVDVLAGLYPRSKFICCDRDVRDCAVSAWHFFNNDGRKTEEQTLEEYAVFHARGYYRPYIMKARAGAARLEAGRYIEIRYEDHKADAPGQIRRLLDFIGIASSDRDVQTCVEGASFRALSGRESGDEQKDSFYRKGVIGDWKNHFSEEFGEFLVKVSRTPLDQPVPVFVPGMMQTRPDNTCLTSTAER